MKTMKTMKTIVTTWLIDTFLVVLFITGIVIIHVNPASAADSAYVIQVMAELEAKQTQTQPVVQIQVEQIKQIESRQPVEKPQSGY